MRFKLSKIKYRFIVQIIFYVLTGILIGGILLLNQKKLADYSTLEKEFIFTQKLINDSYASAALFRAELEESVEFFNEGQNEYTLNFTRKLTAARDTLQNVFELKHLARRIESENLNDTLFAALELYRTSFTNFSLAKKEMGSFDLGNTSKLRKTSSEIIRLVGGSSDVELLSVVQDLKDHEAAYLYHGKMSDFYQLNDIATTLQYYSFPDETDFTLTESITNLSEQYQELLVTINNIVERIGDQSQELGLAHEFEQSHTHLLSVLDFVQDELTSLTTRYRLTVWVITGLIILIIVAVFILAQLRFSKSVTTPLQIITGLSFSLSKGKLNEKKIEDELPFEFDSLRQHLHTLQDSLQEKKKFVDDLLKQKFKADITLQGKNDTFGKTLLALKENMRKTRDEQLRYSKENEHRRYLNEGVAKFADVMRTSTNNMSKLADEFIRELVRYLEAIQGGLFLVDEKNEDKLYLAAAFAYNRKKYIEKTIGIGEGLVGTCAIERKSINLTEIPEDYIEITSGLGDAPPNNLLLLPAIHEGTLIGVIEIASIKKFADVQIELGENIAASLASTIIAARVNTKTSELLEKSQQQAAEMAEQEEEMRQNMEELKATQEESQRREEELEGMLAAIDQAFYVLEYDTDGTIIKVNQKLLFLLDKHVDHVLGKTHQEIFGKGTKADSLVFANIGEGNSVELIEDVTINRKPTTLRNNFSPIRGKSGDTLRILNILTINY